MSEQTKPALSVAMRRDVLDLMVRAVARSRERLVRVSTALDSANVRHALGGGHAVTAWVETIDPSATRNCPDIHLVIDRCDVAAACDVLSGVGLLTVRTLSPVLLLNGPNDGEREAIHLLIAGENARADELFPVRSLAESTRIGQFMVLDLSALARTLLTSYRLVDCVLVRDLLDVRLLDPSWVGRLPAQLAMRLQLLIDTPDG